MKKYSVLILSGLVLVLFCLALSSCKDDEPVVKPKLSFASSAVTVNEADGLIEVEVILDKPASVDVVVSYDLDGDAYDEVKAEAEETFPDYGVVGDYGEVTIEKGETSGIIQLQLYADFVIEDDETIDISISNVDNEGIEITREDDTKITLQQEQNGVVVILNWDESYTDVDMDLVLRVADIGENPANGTITWASINESTVSGEGIFIPLSIENVVYGLSYTYYSGTADPMNFTVTFKEAVNGVFEAVEDQSVSSGTYSLANINAWTNLSATKVAQTFENVDGEFVNFSSITPPASGSRTTSTNTLPLSTKSGSEFFIKSQKLLKSLRKN